MAIWPWIHLLLYTQHSGAVRKFWKKALRAGYIWGRTHPNTLPESLLQLMQARMTFWNLSPTKLFFGVMHTMRVQALLSKQKPRKISNNDKEKNLLKLHRIFLVILLLCDGQTSREKEVSFWDYLNHILPEAHLITCISIYVSQYISFSS